MGLPASPEVVDRRVVTCLMFQQIHVNDVACYPLHHDPGEGGLRLCFLFLGALRTGGSPAAFRPLAWISLVSFLAPPPCILERDSGEQGGSRVDCVCACSCR